MAQDDDTCVLAMVDAGAIPHYLRVLATHLLHTSLPARAEHPPAPHLTTSAC